MSRQNKKEFKPMRRGLRQATGLNKHPKLEPNIPLEVSSGVLTDPKAKLNATFRRHMLASRDCVIDYPRCSVESADSQIKRKARNMNMRQLCNAIARCPRKVRACEQALADLELPVEREPFEIALQYFWMLNTAVLEEHKFRTHAFLNRFAPLS